MLSNDSLMKKPHIQLSDPERDELTKLLAKGSLKAKTFKRATALLELDRGKTLTEVAQMLQVSYQSVLTWRTKYNQEALAMLYDKPRSGRPPEIDGLARAQITALACSEAPEGYGRWSYRLLADKIVELGYCEHISYNKVREILKKTS